MDILPPHNQIWINLVSRRRAQTSKEMFVIFAAKVIYSGYSIGDFAASGCMFLDMYKGSSCSWLVEQKGSESFLCSLQVVMYATRYLENLNLPAEKAKKMEMNLNLPAEKAKKMEMRGIDPRTSRMLSERSTIWATSPGHYSCSAPKSLEMPALVCRISPQRKS